MPARAAFLALLLPASPVLAQDAFLSGTPVECAALEALVVYGLIDGGEGGDTSELGQIVENSDGRACFFELETYGYAAGLMDDTCEAGMEIIAAYGAPEDWELTSTEIVSGVLLNDTYLCEELLAGYGS